MRKIATEADVATALAEPLAVVYKHSPICPTSGIAYEEMRSLRRLHDDVPVYLVDVIHSRPLSRYISSESEWCMPPPRQSFCRPALPPGTARTSIFGPMTWPNRLELLKAQRNQLEDTA